MHLRPALRLVLVSLLAAAPAAARAGAPPLAPAGGAEPGQLCRAAIAAVEREAGLPPRLLAAMARVESGRRDPDTGWFHPWPWTLNAEGRGSFFPTKAAAVAAVQGLQAQGVRSIDVGCMQINLRHHPNAFASLEEAFDPTSNARYAARFLRDLQAARGDWMRSASHYHSQTPESWPTPTAPASRRRWKRNSRSPRPWRRHRRRCWPPRPSPRRRAFRRRRPWLRRPPSRAAALR